MVPKTPRGPCTDPVFPIREGMEASDEYSYYFALYTANIAVLTLSYGIGGMDNRYRT
ncbi:hypothetical protein G9A89_000472 [Geosiphon pyriformis]|nr:hypothetical protein G9A89_000472 [Geosiphon pyriformis]